MSIGQNKSAEEMRRYQEILESFIDEFYRSPSPDEDEALLWKAEFEVWGASGCGHCKSGRGCKRFGPVEQACGITH